MSIIRRIGFQLSQTALRPPLIWLRHRGLCEADVMIASYPRSGNTWFRFLLANILTGETVGFENINRAAPQMGLQAIGRPLLPGGGRLIKTHEPWRREYGRAVYLVRDVRDVMLSYYTRGKALGLLPGTSFDEFLPRFLEGRFSSVGSWANHVRSWMGSPLTGRGGVLVVRYEDMRGDTRGGLEELLQFLGCAVDAGAIERAITANSLENMRAEEDRSQYFPRGADGTGRFVREGAIGGWREKLTQAQAALVDQHAGPELAQMGYAAGVQ